MFDGVQPAPDTCVPHLVSAIVASAENLLQQQLKLLRAEWKTDLHIALKAGVLLVIGATLGLMGGVFFCSMLIRALAWAEPELPLWAC